MDTLSCMPHLKILISKSEISRKQIAKNLGISPITLHLFLNQHPGHVMTVKRIEDIMWMLKKNKVGNYTIIHNRKEKFSISKIDR